MMLYMSIVMVYNMAYMYFMQRAVVMEFRVHVGGEFSMNPKEYIGGRTGSMIFVEPGKVEWHLMVENLEYHGYKGNAELYYLDPGREAPEGLVLMLGREQVDELVQAHLGKKVCDLYIVNDERSDNDE